MTLLPPRSVQESLQGLLPEPGEAQGPMGPLRQKISRPAPPDEEKVIWATVELILDTQDRPEILITVRSIGAMSRDETFIREVRAPGSVEQLLDIDDDNLRGVLWRTQLESEQKGHPIKLWVIPLGREQLTPRQEVAFTTLVRRERPKLVADFHGEWPALEGPDALRLVRTLSYEDTRDPARTAYLKAHAEAQEQAAKDALWENGLGFRPDGTRPRRYDERPKASGVWLPVELEIH